MRSLYAVCLLICAHASSSQAALTVTGTRFVYAADARALTVRISNGGEAPILAQSWLDRGQINQDPSGLSVPFVVSRPLLRLDPGQRSALEVRYTGEALPADRESLFWLNFLEVSPLPPRSTHLLRLSYRLRMKLLFRPAGLAGSAEEAGRQLTWRAHRKVLEACNKAPFFVSLTAQRLEPGAADEVQRSATIAPFTCANFPLTGASATPAFIHYQFVADRGEMIDARAPVHHD
ncbi:fimbrial biogenesis chaperone [Pseudomonas sp. BRG-100]|uniref:fimbrial biogenesis chaperone n=1 Tax=Pseudomonas sp. BRG-100 TaxID=1524267 RepID=UPI0006ACEC49|nr:fimbria/pilus periplasmic chaperone [Pseudomonas sp. BRG-100]